MIPMRAVFAGAAASVLLATAAAGAWSAKFQGVDPAAAEIAGTIEIERILWGARRADTPVTKGAGTFVVIAPRGPHSERLEAWRRDGAVIPKLIISNGARGSAYLEYHLTDAQVISIDPARRTSSQIREEVAFSYKTVKFQY